MTKTTGMEYKAMIMFSMIHSHVLNIISADIYTLLQSRKNKAKIVRGREGVCILAMCRVHSNLVSGGVASLQNGPQRSLYLVCHLAHLLHHVSL